MSKYVYDVVITQDEDGGYDVSVPTLPGCFTFGNTFEEAVYMAEDALKTFVASLLLDGEEVAPFSVGYKAEEDETVVTIFFETDESYIVRGEVVSAAQAARELGVSASRITHMLASGILEGYRSGRNTMITVDSINKRKEDPHPAGRPRTILEA